MRWGWDGEAGHIPLEGLTLGVHFAFLWPNLHPWYVRSRIRHYRQNGGMAPTPSSSSRRHGPRMKKLGLVILTCSFFSLVELAGKNVKVLERSMRKSKAFCSCAQKIIYKTTIDICSRIFTKNVPG